MDFEGSEFSAVEVDDLLQVVSANLGSDYLQEREREEAAVLSSIENSGRSHSNFSYPGVIESYSRARLDLPRS
jgi:hypothetical protein